MKGTYKLKRGFCFFMGIIILFSLSGCAGTGQKDEGLTAGITPAKVQEREADGDFIKAYADFAVKSFKNFTDGEKNSMISPISVMVALSMAANGAEGETLEEMKEVLAPGMDVEKLNQYLHTLSQKLTQGESSMGISNSMWIRDEENSVQVEVNRDFLQVLSDYYSAQVFKEPFNGETVDKINNWVFESTDGVIKNMIDEIDERTIIYLINAVTFNAEWENIYYDTAIFNGMFHNSDNTEIETKFMYSQENKYISYNGAKGFIKDYKGGSFSFAALLPPEDVTLDEFIKNMEGEALIEAIKGYETESVLVYMPKFSCEYEIELSSMLKNMGMERAFDGEKAQFEKMCSTTGGNVYIGQVLHKTFINVDERGTTAGAAAMVEIKNEGAALGEEVNLNRPFIYFVIDNDTGIPLFMGKVLNLN